MCFLMFFWWKSNQTSMSVALSHHSIYSSGSNCWCSLKSCLISLSLSCVGTQRARWLLQDRECFETPRQAVNLSSLHALPTANMNTNGCNSDAFSKVSHTSKMDQWFRDDGWVTVNYRWRRVLTSVIPVHPLQSWVSLEGIITLLSCCCFFLPPHFSFLDPVKQFAGTLCLYLRVVRDTSLWNLKEAKNN